PPSHPTTPPPPSPPTCCRTASTAYATTACSPKPRAPPISRAPVTCSPDQSHKTSPPTSPKTTSPSRILVLAAAGACTYSQTSPAVQRPPSCQTAPPPPR